MELKIQFPVKGEQYSVLVTEEKKGLQLLMEYPVVITELNKRNKKFRYDSIHREDGKVCAKCMAEMENSRFEITDIYEVKTHSIQICRSMVCIEAEQKTAVRWTMEWRGRDKKASGFDDYQFIIPGAFYNKNDTDLDGRDDYLGTFCQDYRDDRNPSLSIMEYCCQSNQFMAWIRGDIPKKDTTVSREQIKRRHFTHDTDIGSLGMNVSEYHSKEFVFRCDYPFYERASFCLNVDGSEWAAYKEVETGTQFQASYSFYMGDAKDLTEAGWKVTEFQMKKILNPEISLPFTLAEARKYRREMTFNSFREFPDKKGRPAGFFVHFSPRKTYSQQNLLEYGFCGQQALISYAMLGEAEECREEEYRIRAIKTLDFFVDYCIEKSGLPNAMYHVDTDRFVYWWTGILYPFQYAKDRERLEQYLGKQLVSSLMPVAEELKKVKGNYCRTMIDAMYYLFLSYLKEKETGTTHKNWCDAVMKFCDKMLEIQNENGSWNRAYTMDAKPLTKPKEWFGSNEKETGSGAIFPAELLVKVYQYTKDKRYLTAAERAAEFVRSSYVDDITYIGGLNDTTHVKSVKIDAVGVMFAMRTMLTVYEQNKKPALLEGARNAARVLATWTYLWDIPFDPATTLGKYGFKTTGWTGCDVIPACSYVDDEFVEFVPDLLKIAEYCKDEKLVVLAKIVTRGMQHGLSMPQNMYGYSMPGVQCEGYMTSLWLADTESTDFSGASAKNKGDDNDTCNGLVNGQALLNLAYIMNRYNTYDFNKIIAQIVKGGHGDGKDS